MADLNPNTLTPPQRRALWDGIKQHHPELADLLTNDAIFNELKTEFNGTVLFDTDHIQPALDYMRKNSRIKPATYSSISLRKPKI